MQTDMVDNRINCITIKLTFRDECVIELTVVTLS